MLAETAQQWESNGRRVSVINRVRGGVQRECLGSIQFGAPVLAVWAVDLCRMAVLWTQGCLLM